VRALAHKPGDPTHSAPTNCTWTLASPPDAAVRARLQRTHEIRSSCGVCGLADPQQILEGTPPLLPGVPRLDRARVPEWPVGAAAAPAAVAAPAACHARCCSARRRRCSATARTSAATNALDRRSAWRRAAARNLARASPCCRAGRLRPRGQVSARARVR